MKKFLLVFFLVAGAQIFAGSSTIRVTQQNLGSVESRVICKEVNPLPPINGLTGPLFFGWYILDVTVGGELFHLSYSAHENAAVTWTDANGGRRAAYRSCELAKTVAEEYSQYTVNVFSELMDKVKNADIELVIKDTEPPVKYCHVSEATLYFFPSSTNIQSWKEVFKMVPCP